MNKQEYLLTLLTKECAEVQKLCTKAQRFGLDDTEPGDNITNAQNIVHELNDVIAIVELMREDGMLDDPTPEDVEKFIESKKIRTQQWMKYSRKRGHLCD